MPKQREDLPSGKVEAYVDYVTREPLVWDPGIVDGVVVSYCDSYCSLSSGYLPYGQIDPHWIFQPHPKQLRQYVHRKFLLKGAKKAERMDSFAHYWSHLYNISNETTWGAVKGGLEDIAAYRDQSDLDILTLEQVGKLVREEEQ